MHEGIIYDCPNAECRTPIYTGKCSKACIEKYNKEMGIKPKTNADRIRAMTDEELAEMLCCADSLGWCKNLPECYRLLDTPDGVPEEKCKACLVEWLQQPAEGE